MILPGTVMSIIGGYESMSRRVNDLGAKVVSPFFSLSERQISSEGQ